ncbi:hypothetical protein JHK82_028079 [Glycine max]|uniref:Leucine-rich repeat-containing N-terminal plant-type domain-containing protein n=2 Tax=Glycine subgen. Soja TaxID=1462606 RepID=A0A0R0HSR8_SOYBN|nr:hypothetical protein JHK87_027992 [Glycine soja]KAG4997304.1 hypothetical protein JHK85_028743 [Glycine max]KAG5004063.1 hypothetical protein JHK86_028202 [Glycine max]KAG5127244.1 hypothetical protein JHK82_028079 [Glycine max]KAG5151857.1 hypothetical protein JHK84_028329 [Glycine max]
MGSYFLKILFAVLVCFSHTKLFILGFISPLHVKCIEKERQALLNFKQGLQDYSGMLSRWSDDDNSRDCCKWKGIECNNETVHVQMLDLRASDVHFFTGDLYISLFLELQNMEYLDLSRNLFPDSQIPEQMGNFKNLRYLNLSDLSFVGGIPSQLGNLSKLEYLDLKRIFVGGAIPSQLGNLSKLRYVDLAGNSLSGEIPFQWVTSLSSLTTLDLSSFGNLSVDTISSLFDSHSNLSTSLSILDLSNNMLTSSTFQLLFNYSINLQELYLSVLLIKVFLCHMLPFKIPHHLVTLHLSQNLLKLLAIFNWISNFTTNLHLLSHGGKILEGPIPDGFGKVINHLEILSLHFNKLQGENSASLWNICTLKELHLYNNNLSGKISSFIQNSIFMIQQVFQTLDLSDNRITGMLPSHSNWTYLRKLDLSNNHLKNDLHGEIHSHIRNLGSLEFLDLSGNHFFGKIPYTLSNIDGLAMLDLSNIGNKEAFQTHLE